MSLKSTVIRYCPDWLFAIAWNNLKESSGIKIDKIGSVWIIRGIGMNLLSPTSKFTSVSMKHFENRFEKYFKIQSGDVCLDVGSCIGDTTVPMLMKTGITGFVYAVEPDELNYYFLDKNMMSIQKTDNFKLLKTAVWYYDGEMELREHFSPTGHSLVQHDLVKSSEVVAKNKIKVSKLDTLFDGIHINFAKIDVQWAEVEVLLGATKFMDTTDKLMVEIHGKDTKYSTRGNVEKIIKEKYDNVVYDNGMVYAWR